MPIFAFCPFISGTGGAILHTAELQIVEVPEHVQLAEDLKVAGGGHAAGAARLGSGRRPLAIPEEGGHLGEPSPVDHRCLINCCSCGCASCAAADFSIVYPGSAVRYYVYVLPSMYLYWYQL